MKSPRAMVIMLVAIYLVFLAWFIYLFVTKTFGGTAANLYSNAYGLIPLLGGIYGLALASRWGGLKSAVGKAVSFLSLGLITWGCGIGIWMYYNLILGVEVPYPSWADALFILSWPLWGMGAAYLSVATGAKFALKQLKGRVMLFIIPALIALFSYYFLVILARGGVISDFDQGLKTFFDLAYPIGDVVILTTAVLIIGLSYKFFGGIYKTAIYLILGAFVMNYFADFTFSYTTTLGTYYNGSLADVLFATTMTMLGAGIALLDPRAAVSQEAPPS